jgi:hypothetical protein
MTGYTYSSTPSVPLAEDVTVPADRWNPATTFYADGTELMMIWDGGRKSRRVVTMGMTQGAVAHEFQACRYPDGSIHNVDPRVLHKN